MLAFSDSIFPRLKRLLGALLLVLLMGSPSGALAVHSLHSAAYPRLASVDELVRSSSYYDLQQVSHLVQAQDFRAASVLAARSLEKNPGNVLALYYLGYSQEQLAEAASDPATKHRHLESAFRTFYQLRAVSPDLSLVTYKLAQAAEGLERPEEAHQYYQEAVKMEPDNAVYHFSLGSILDDLNRLEESTAEYERAIALNPGFPFAYNNLGLVQQKQGKHALAEKSFLQALTLEPDYPYALLNLGNLYLEIDQPGRAVPYYRKLLVKTPENAWANLYLGHALMRTGEAEAALSAYERSARLNPSYAPTFYLMAVTCYKLQRVEDAMRFAEQYLSLAPNGEQAESLLRLIAVARLQLGKGKVSSAHPAELMLPLPIGGEKR